MADRIILERRDWRPESPHLEVVLAKFPSDGSYVCWLYNKQSRGFGMGHYFRGEDALERALKDYKER